MNAKRIIGWSVLGLIALLLVIAVGGYFYLQSGSFQRFALRKIDSAAEEATGGRTEVGGMDFSLSTLTAHLYNITVRGTEGPGQPPLLHADKLTVGVKIVSAFKRQVALSELVIERPVVHLLVDKQGKNNLPAAPPSKNGRSSTSVFDLAVRHAQIIDGEVDYNDRKTPMEADLYDLGTDIHFATLAKRYDGELSYKDGKLKYADYAPMAHNLSLKFSANPEKFSLQSLALKVGESVMQMRAEIANYSNPVATGDYQIQIHTQDFASFSPSTKPAGDITLAGTLHYQATGNEPLMRAVAIDGRVASEALAAFASGNRVDVRKLQGTYQLANGRLQVKDFSAESLGGRITAGAEMKDLDTTPDARVQAALHDISLSALQRVAGQKPSNTATVAGRLNGTAEAGWKGSIDNLKAKLDLTIKAVASGNGNPSSSEVPVNGLIHATYDGKSQTVALRDTSLQIPSATLTANGEVSDRSSLAIQLVARDLHQLALIASSFQSGQETVPAVSGAATLHAVVRGSMKKPSITGQLSAQNLQVEGSQWSSVKMDLAARPSQFSIRNGSLVNAQQGQASFSANVGLRNWTYEPSSPIQATLNAQRLRVSELLQLAKRPYPVSGDLSAKISVSGTQLDPKGSGSVQIANARAYDEPIQNLAMQFEAANQTVTSKLNVTTSAGAVNANLSYTPKTKAYKVKLDAPAVLLQKLQTVQAKNLGVSGTVSASASGEGTVDNPQLNAVVQLPQLQVRQNSISGIKAELKVAGHTANLNFDTQVSQASIHARGRVALSGDYQTDAVIDTNVIPIEVLLATYSSSLPEGFAGQTELHATLKGPLKDKSRVEAHLSIPVLKASYQQLQIGITKPIRADYVNSVVTLQPSEISGTGTALALQGRMPIGGNAAPTLSAQGSIDARILRMISPDVQSSGVVALDVRASGTSAQPRVQGQVQFKNIAVATSAAPVGVEQLNGTVDITSDHLQISKLTGMVGGGQVSVGGSVMYKPRVQFNIAVKGNSVRLRYPDGLRTLLETNLALSGDMQQSTLNGKVLIDSLSFTPDFDLAKFGDQFSTGANTPAQPGFADTVQLRIGVQSQESLNATSSQVSIAGRVALQVIGTAANPVIIGRTNLSSGELFFRNLRYKLEKGVITFDDPNETHPVMNVSVSTTVEQYNLTLSMRGPLDKLTTQYLSDPPLATADIISLIARGKTTSEAAASSQSTDSMIASQALGQVSGGIQKLAGLSSLQIDPTIGGNSQNPSATIALQQRVTKNFLFTFSTDVAQPGNETVQGEYQINKRWSVSMARDQLGGVSVDGRYHTRF